jgi:hypothetical protein
VRATYYTEDGIGQGHCSFTGYTLPAGIFGTALSMQSWDGASQCGSCVEVTNPSTGAKVKAMVSFFLSVDHSISNASKWVDCRLVSRMSQRRPGFVRKHIQSDCINSSWIFVG